MSIRAHFLLQKRCSPVASLGPERKKRLLLSAPPEQLATCLAALGTLVDLFANFFETLSFLLPDVLLLLERCIDQVRCSLLLFALLSFGCSYILLCLYRN